MSFMCYHRVMHFSRYTRIVLVLLLGFVLLITRVCGDHLHLCFDGQEPLIVLSVQDSGLHHQGMSVGERHADQGVELVSASPVKAKLSGLDGALLAVLYISLALLSRLRTRPLFSASLAIKSAPIFLRPPLRGPPL